MTPNPYESPAAVEESKPSSRRHWQTAFVLMALAYCFLPFAGAAIILGNFQAILATGVLCFGCVMASLEVARRARALDRKSIHEHCAKILEICDRMIRRIDECSS